MKLALVPTLMFNFLLAFCTTRCHGDEGMYLFNELPVELLGERHEFEPDQRWSDQLRLSCVRFNSGGSGSFISSNGLVLTNHHVASDTLHKLSSAERNLIDDGYLAKSLDQELKAPDLLFTEQIIVRILILELHNQCGDSLS
jgi:hypothetical protein